MARRGKGHLVQHLGRKLGHRDPTIALRQQRALGSEPPDRFTHRGHPRAKVCDQTLNGDRGTGGKMAK